jgi:hypothetical protein
MLVPGARTLAGMVTPAGPTASTAATRLSQGRWLSAMDRSDPGSPLARRIVYSDPITQME